MVFVAIEYVKAAQDEFIFFLNEFVEELNVFDNIVFLFFCAVRL